MVHLVYALSIDSWTSSQSRISILFQE